MKRFKTPKRQQMIAGAAVVLFAAVAGCGQSSSAAKSADPHRPLLFSDFADDPDGSLPARFESGQAASLAPVADPSWTLFVERGQLTYAPITEGPAAGYLRTPDFGRPITRMGMEWVVNPGLAGGPGVAAMGITGQPVDPTDSRGTPMPMHLLVRRDIWNFSVSPGPFESDPRLITIGSGTFDPPLVEDGITRLRVDVTLDGPNATLELPDGTVSHLSDPRIASWAGRFGFFEVYSQSAVNDGRVGIARVWADA